MRGITPYRELVRKVVFEYFEKFPEIESHTLARILRRDHPEFFNSHEHARSYVRRYRGKHGKQSRKNIIITKYYKDGIKLA